MCRVQAVEQKPWTFLVYMAAANDLSQYALLDLEEMVQAGSNENINVIVYLTLHEEGQQKYSAKLYIENGSIVQIGDRMVRDSGDVATLQEALQWACIDYPSDHIAVVLWNHGSGPLNRSAMMQAKGVCYDFDTDNYLTDRDCLQAFSWAKNSLRGGQKFDVIAFDASFLGSIEMAYALSACADYMVASEEEVPADGYEYAYVLRQCATQNFDSLSFAQLMVRAYQQEYTGESDYTLSAIDLNLLQPLADNCSAVAQILTTQLTGKNKADARTALKKCINTNLCPSFDQGIYIDVCQFYKNVLKYIDGLKLSNSVINQFKQLVNNGLRLLTHVVKANVTSARHAKAGGLSIYFSRFTLDPSYYGLYWTECNPNWLNLLEAFLE
jgi:hypothetical protein